MTDGFTYRGQHSSVLGLTLLSYKLNPPEVREYEDEVAGRHGTIDYGSEFGKRDIEIRLDVISTDEPLKVRASKILAWLDPTQGAGDLIFDDLPDRLFKAKYTGKLGLDQIAQYGEFGISMKCTDPFAKSIQDTSAKAYGQGFEYGQGLEYFSNAVQITASGQQVTIDQLGNYPVAPRIVVRGAFTNFSISDGINTFTFTGTNTAADVLEIDCSSASVKKNGVNAYGQSNGVFFSLKPGLTTFACSATNPNFSIEFIFRHTYL